MIINIYGTPIAQPRYHTGKGFSYIRKTSKGKQHPIIGFKERIYWACFNAVRDLDHYPLKGGVYVELDFIFKRHKGIPKNQKYKTTKPDRDNLDKAVLDAMNGIIYVDDAQVCDGPIRKLWGDEAQVIIKIEAIDD